MVHCPFIPPTHAGTVPPVKETLVPHGEADTVPPQPVARLLMILGLAAIVIPG
jgi:hypothetical protein